MNASDTLDLALGQLDGEESARALAEVDLDPALRDRVDRLRESLRQMLGDPDVPPPSLEPPAGLRDRTLARVERASAERVRVLDFSPAPRRRFTPGDFAVAATIFLASLVALAPAVFRSREQWGRAACANRLQKVGMRMNQYAALNHEYPFVAADDAVPHVGTMLCRLNESFPIDPADLHCPCAGADCEHVERIPDMKTMTDMYKRSPDEARRALDLDYAFNVGYRDGDGKPGAVPAYPRHVIPLLADQPDFDGSGHILEGNSPNHDGRGQNVYFADGHVAWHPTRRVSPRDGDIYLNKAERPAYGLDSEDAVLLPMALRVNGR